MGYKKLDEVMELLTDELDEFKTTVERLERLTENVDGIKVKPDVSEILYILKRHLEQEKDKTENLSKLINSIETVLKKSSITPKYLIVLQHIIWLLTLVIIAYLALKLE